MSEENLDKRLRDAGVTDLSPEGLLKRARESGDEFHIKRAEKMMQSAKDYEAALKEFNEKRDQRDTQSAEDLLRKLQGVRITDQTPE